MTEPLAPRVAVDDFAALDIRAGTVTRAEPFPKARKPAYRLWIDFGGLGVRKTSAQITARHTPAELVGRQVLAVVNFPPRQVADFMSEVLVLGLPDAACDIVLVRPDSDVAPGTRLY